MRRQPQVSAPPAFPFRSGSRVHLLVAFRFPLGRKHVCWAGVRRRGLTPRSRAGKEDDITTVTGRPKKAGFQNGHVRYDPPHPHHPGLLGPTRRPRARAQPCTCSVPLHMVRHSASGASLSSPSPSPASRSKSPFRQGRLQKRVGAHPHGGLLRRSIDPPPPLQGGDVQRASGDMLRGRRRDVRCG